MSIFVYYYQIYVYKKTRKIRQNTGVFVNVFSLLFAKYDEVKGFIINF